MIRNVFGKAVTKSTLLSLPEYDRNREISREDLASVALALKNSQGKDKDEEEGLSYVERLRDQCAREEKTLTLGWIYNASGGAITFVDSCDWRGGLASSSLYPVRIENGQWGVFLYVHRNYESSGAVLYEGLNSFSQTCYWYVAWMISHSSGQVYVKIENSADWDNEDEWNNVNKALEESGSQHRTKQEGWRSVISASPGPHVVFEALLTIEHL